MSSYPQSFGTSSSDIVDVSELVKLAGDLDTHQRRDVRTFTERGLAAGIDYVYANAVADATPMKDTGLMLESIHKDNGRSGYGRRVWCGPDPAGFMNEFGNNGRPPRPWLFKHLAPGAAIVERIVADGVDGML